MSKVVKLSSVMEREEKLKEIYEGLEEIKDCPNDFSNIFQHII